MDALSRILYLKNRKATTKSSIIMLCIVPRDKCVGKRRVYLNINTLERETPIFSLMKIYTPWLLYLIRCTQ